MYKSLTRADGEATLKWWPAVMDRATAVFTARLDLRWWVGLSLVLSMVIVASAKTATGDFLGGFTDHLHHTRATWTFLHAGWDVFTRPFGQVGLEVPYPQLGLYWPEWPIPYPPGMLVVFLPVAFVGRYVAMSGPLYGKVLILYLVVITHAALWVIASLVRRPRAPLGTLPLLMVWLFCVRFALMGFYEGAWLLAGALAIVHMNKGQSGAALVCFTSAALISYRGVAFLPMALVAFFRFLAQDYTLRKRIAVFAFCGVGCALVLFTFRTLSVHLPPPELRHHIESPLLAFTSRTYFVILIGVATSIYLAKFEGLVVGASAALATILSVIHGGHSWHGASCIPLFMSFGLNTRTTARGTLFATLLVALLWQFAYYFSPFQFFEELLKFIDTGGGGSR